MTFLEIPCLIKSYQGFVFKKIFFLFIFIYYVYICIYSLLHYIFFVYILWLCIYFDLQFTFSMRFKWVKKQISGLCFLCIPLGSFPSVLHNINLLVVFIILYCIISYYTILLFSLRNLLLF